MTDKELIDKVAKLWLECGGDAEGLLFTWRALYERIEKLEASDD